MKKIIIGAVAAIAMLTPVPVCSHVRALALRVKRRCPSADGHSAALPQQDKEREVLKIIAATILLALSIVQAQAEEQTRSYGPNGKSLGTPSSPRRLRAVTGARRGRKLTRSRHARV